jgi:hypothetical protein
MVIALSMHVRNQDLKKNPQSFQFSMCGGSNSLFWCLRGFWMRRLFINGGDRALRFVSRRV